MNERRAPEGRLDPVRPEPWGPAVPVTTDGPAAVAAGGAAAAGLPADPVAAVAEPPPRVFGVFGRKVAGVFATQIGLFGISFLTSFALARLLNPTQQGQYQAISNVPGMITSIGLFGLPGAVNYFAARGTSLTGLLRASYLFTALLSLVLGGATLLFLPELQGSILKATSAYPDLLRLTLIIALPLATITAFGGSILYGRQAVSAYNVIQVAGAGLTLLAIMVLMAGLGLAVPGGVAGYILGTVLTAVLVMIVVHRLTKTAPSGQATSYRALGSYGMRVYPGNITGFFHYRVDTLIMQAMAVSATAAETMVGTYTIAVLMAEILFYVPNSVSTLFLPRVAGSTPEEANRAVGRVGRFTTLLTLCLAAALLPTAFVGIHLVLPKYVESLPAFVVLLPGVISFSVAKVMTSYVGGRGRPGLVSLGTAISLVVNVVLNVLLIPRLGIVGASFASLVSYTLQAGIALVFAHRLSGLPVRTLFVPGRAEVLLLVDTIRQLAARAMRGRRRGLGTRGGG